jgi:hypothetical protein
MLNIELSLNVLTLGIIALVAMFIGYSFKSRVLRKKQLKIQELRKEIVGNHAHILELQKEYVTLESQIKGAKTPVLPLKPSSKDYIEEAHRVSDGAL